MSIPRSAARQSNSAATEDSARETQAPVQIPIISRDPIDRKWLDVNIPCQSACPIQTDVAGYIEALVRRDYEEAYRINRRDNVLPAVLGRVCHRPCEPACRHGREGLGEPVQICFLKRSASDFGMRPLPVKPEPNGKKVCIIGAGPAGLTAANDLALRGYNVTVLEQYEEAGGMLRYGIPAFRLPYDLVAKDIRSITDLGVEIKTNVRVDGDRDLAKLKRKHDAVILAGGCMLATQIDLPGMDAEGCFWGLDFMMAANRNQLELKPRRVVVIGGGFTAVDCARTSFRLEAEHITLAYRRTEAQLRVGIQEVHALKDEGIHLDFLASPVAIETKEGRVCGIKLIRNALDEDGKAKAMPGTEFTVEADTVILAIGQTAEDLDGVDVEPEAAPTRPKDDKLFYFAGDFRNGSGTVIEACADGRKIAREVDEALTGTRYEEVVEIEPIELDDMPRWREHDYIPAEPMPHVPLEERLDKTREVEEGFSRVQAFTEAHRCYLCHYDFQIDMDRCIYCMKCIDVMPVDCITLIKDVTADEDGALHYEPTEKWQEVEGIAINNDRCIRCGNCVRACPVDCISVSRYHLHVVQHEGNGAPKKKGRSKSKAS